MAGRLRRDHIDPPSRRWRAAIASPYRVALTAVQRDELRTLVGLGTAPARTRTRARVLLRADHGEGGPGWSDAAIRQTLDLNPGTVLRTYSLTTRSSCLDGKTSRSPASKCVISKTWGSLIVTSQVSDQEDRWVQDKETRHLSRSLRLV